jgi:hypothetical protein
MRRIFAVSLLSIVVAGSAFAGAKEPGRAVLGSWSCMTERDHAASQITFRADGTVTGNSQGRSLSGRYFVKDDNLSIVAADQVIAASALRVMRARASANLVNGDTINCSRRG